MSRKKKADADAKAAVFGVRGRGGRMRAFVVKGCSPRHAASRALRSRREGLLDVLYRRAPSLTRDEPGRYRHYIINHAERYLEGRVHTNNIENFCSVLKGTLGGTYIAARPFHLDAYLDERVFRFYTPELTDGPRFAQVVKAADGRRVTYKALICKRGR